MVTEQQIYVSFFCQIKAVSLLAKAGFVTPEK